MHLKLFVAFAFATFCSAAVFGGKNISVQLDGSILVTSTTTGNTVVITGAQGGLNGQGIEVVVTGPGVPTRAIQIPGQLTNGGFGSQINILASIASQFQGTVGERTFEALLSQIEQAVAIGQVSPLVLKALVNIDSLQQISLTGIRGVASGLPLSLTGSRGNSLAAKIALENEIEKEAAMEARLGGVYGQGQNVPLVGSLWGQQTISGDIQSQSVINRALLQQKWATQREIQKETIAEALINSQIAQGGPATLPQALRESQIAQQVEAKLAQAALDDAQNLAIQNELGNTILSKQAIARKQIVQAQLQGQNGIVPVLAQKEASLQAKAQSAAILEAINVQSQIKNLQNVLEAQGVPKLAAKQVAIQKIAAQQVSQQQQLAIAQAQVVLANPAATTSVQTQLQAENSLVKAILKTKALIEAQQELQAQQNAPVGSGLIRALLQKKWQLEELLVAVQSQQVAIGIESIDGAIANRAVVSNFETILNQKVAQALSQGPGLAGLQNPIALEEIAAQSGVLRSSGGAWGYLRQLQNRNAALGLQQGIPIIAQQPIIV